MPSFRNAIVLLLAAMFAIAPFAQSFGAPAGADCVEAHASGTDEGCRGKSAPDLACNMPYAAGCVAAISDALVDAASEVRFISPVAPLRSALASPARAPDTAPPKAVSA